MTDGEPHHFAKPPLRYRQPSDRQCSTLSQHTIEEKIIQLQRTKRDIADSLLEGSDAPAKLSTEELLKLIMEE